MVLYDADILYDANIPYDGVTQLVVPVTVWRPTDGNGEYTSASSQNVIDQNGVSLVDTAGVNVVSPPTQFTQIPATAWLENNSI